MKLAKSPAWLVELFDALQPEVGGERKQMFGYPCVFEGGNLFTGLFADGLFVRLGEADRARLLATKGAAPFEPMKGRPMREYVVLPPSMLEDEEAVKSFRRTLELSPQFSKVFQLLGTCLMKLGKNDEAVEVLQDAQAREKAEPYADGLEGYTTIQHAIDYLKH